MKTLSIRNPWAWLIVRPDLTDPSARAAALAAGEIKVVENRSWGTRYRGEFLVHVGLRFDLDGYEWVRRHFPNIPLPPLGHYQCGGIIGKVRLDDSIPPELAQSGAVQSRWYMGQHALMVADAQPLPFLQIKGRLGFFEASHPALERI